MTRRALLFTVFWAAAVAIEARPAQACAACACGDNTLTTMGTGQSFAGRMRLYFGIGFRSERQPQQKPRPTRADGLDQMVAFSIAATDRLVLSVEGGVGQRRATTQGPVLYTAGQLDTSARLRVDVWRDADWAPRHVIAWTAAVTLPSPWMLRDGAGRPLPPRAQTSLGAHRASTGLQYRGGGAPLSFFVSGRVAAGVFGGSGAVEGPALFGSALLSLQPRDAFAVMAGAETRVEARAPDLRAVPATLLVGTVAFVFSPLTDVLLSLTVRAPAWEFDALTRTGAAFILGTTVDL